MEDRHVAVDPFMANESRTELWGFFAVYDGHGGSRVADHCEAELHKLLSFELRIELEEQGRHGLPLTDACIADAMTRTFQKIDDQVRTKGSWHMGATATVALLRRHAGGCRLHVANVGDSRAVAVDRRSVVRTSQDHRPSDLSEARRVKEAGGFVAMNRVNGELAVSRALGDHALKEKGVTWRPYTCARDVTHDTAFVIASDGLWDTLEDTDVSKVVEHCRQEGSTDHVAQKLVSDAKRRGSMDNIACVVVFI
jgi:serine/threonine protein phosphatase PrpC